MKNATLSIITLILLLFGLAHANDRDQTIAAAEYFLNDDDATARRSLGFGGVSVQSVAIGCGER